MNLVFRDRCHAGEVLAPQLMAYAGRPGAQVLALPRGGVPVAHAVAAALGLPLAVFVVRKLGAPGHEEYAIGAIASGGVCLLDDEAVQAQGLGEAELGRVLARERQELLRRERLYAGRPSPPTWRGRTLIVVDDGLATGATMRVAVKALRMQGPARIVVAVPTGPADACALLRREADELVCASMPSPFIAVGCWYEDFTQTSDDEVRRLLAG